MASYIFSANPNVVFNPATDTLFIDGNVSASRLRVTQGGSGVIITDGVSTATLQATVREQLTTSNVFFSNGSRLVIGDNTTGNVADSGANDLRDFATTGNDQIIGLAGNDTMTGGAEGNDLFIGNQGDDSIFGSAGNDTVFGGQGADQIVFTGAAASTALLIFGNLGADSILSGGGADTINGGQGNDTILGGGGADTVNGGLGDDSIDGGAGNDTLRGGDGADRITGGAGGNIVSGQVGEDTIVGVAGARDTVFGGQGNDTINYDALVSSDSLLIFANLGDDLIAGGDGSDTINGGQGQDTIRTGIGADFVTGGLGNDVVAFGTDQGGVISSGTTTFTADTITDFVSGTDKIESFIEGSGTGVAGTGANYLEVVDATVASVEDAVTLYAGRTDSLYTFVAGATDGYLVIDTTAGNTAGVPDGTADSVIVLRGLTTGAGFAFGDIIA